MLSRSGRLHVGPACSSRRVVAVVRWFRSLFALFELGIVCRFCSGVLLVGRGGGRVVVPWKACSFGVGLELAERVVGVVS